MQREDRMIGYIFDMVETRYDQRRRFATWAWLTAVLAWAMIPSCGLAGERLTLNFNPDWRFIKADPNATQSPELNDADWQAVSAPHTYNDTDTFDDWSILGHVGEQNQWAGRTWYRKTFTVPESFKGKEVYIEFEAVRQVAEVFLNGQLLGVSKTGFSPFGFDLTQHLRFGRPNCLAVMCDNRFMKDPVARGAVREQRAAGAAQGGPSAVPSQAGCTDLNMAPPANPSLAELSSRFNAGIPEDVNQIQADQIPWNNPHWHPAHGGLYRNVRLYVTDPLHISLPLYSFLQTVGPYVYATDISDKSAKIGIEVPVENGRTTGEAVELAVEVLDRDGKAVLTLKGSEPIASGAKAEFKVSGMIENPEHWEPAYPYLYRVVCKLSVGANVVDTCEVQLGIRAVQWDVNTGFTINGHPLKLHGWGHKPTDEWPGLGAAQPDWMHFYTLDLMKQAGGNFIRWGHCLGGPAQVDAADRLGLITEQPGLGYIIRPAP